MKKLLFFVIFFALIPYTSFAMEGKTLSIKDAEQLWVDTAFPLNKYGVEALPYEQYKENMMRAIAAEASVQDHYHNPLAIAVFKNDAAFAKFLLDHGAKLTHRDMSHQDAFDIFKKLEEEKGSEATDAMRNVISNAIWSSKQ